MRKHEGKQEKKKAKPTSARNLTYFCMNLPSGVAYEEHRSMIFHCVVRKLVRHAVVHCKHQKYYYDGIIMMIDDW